MYDNIVRQQANSKTPKYDCLSYLESAEFPVSSCVENNISELHFHLSVITWSLEVSSCLNDVVVVYEYTCSKVAVVNVVDEVSSLNV